MNLAQQSINETVQKMYEIVDKYNANGIVGNCNVYSYGKGYRLFVQYGPKQKGKKCGYYYKDINTFEQAILKWSLLEGKVGGACVNCSAVYSTKRVNGKNVCNKCYNDFKDKIYKIQYEGVKFEKHEQWWN